MVLPVVLSVPNGGLEVPRYLAPLCRLTRAQIAADRDEGAAEIFNTLSDQVRALVTTPIARVILDMNRSSSDRRRDGVLKTHTSEDVEVWRAPPPNALIEQLLDEHDDYHQHLTDLAGTAVLGIDCHTMAAVGPTIAPDPGERRPLVCLGDGGGACPAIWVKQLQECFARHFPGEVRVNAPFSGGYITLMHGQEMPWLHLEISRSPELSNQAKRQAMLDALTEWCRDHAPSRTAAGPRRG